MRGGHGGNKRCLLTLLPGTSDLSSPPYDLPSPNFLSVFKTIFSCVETEREFVVDTSVVGFFVSFIK